MSSPDGQGYCCPPSAALDTGSSNGQVSDNCGVFGAGGYSPTPSCPQLNYAPGALREMYSLQVDAHGCQYWSLVCTWSPMMICGVGYADAGAFSCVDGG